MRKRLWGSPTTGQKPEICISDSGLGGLPARATQAGLATSCPQTTSRAQQLGGNTPLPGWHRHNPPLTLTGLSRLAMGHVIEDIFHGSTVGKRTRPHLSIGLLAPLALVRVEEQDQLLLDELALLGIRSWASRHGLRRNHSHLLDLRLHGRLSTRHRSDGLYSQQLPTFPKYQDVLVFRGCSDLCCTFPRHC